MTEPEKKTESLRLGRDLNCSSCMYFNYLISFQGECRRHAPSPLTETLTRRKWSETTEKDWCGEYKANAEMEQRIMRACLEQAKEAANALSNLTRTMEAEQKPKEDAH